MLNGIPEDVYHWIGYLGVALYLGAYALLQTGVIRGNGYAYVILNFLAASFVLVGLTVAFSLSAAIVPILWILISVVGLVRMLLLDRMARLNEEESAFVAKIFPEFSRTTARRFLDHGIWLDAEPGIRITQENEPVTHLTFLARGSADVFSSSERIGRVVSGLVGELNVMQKGPASATVRTAEPSRIFMISSEALAELAATDVEFRRGLESGMNLDTRSKLVAANKALTRQKAAAE
ncbi:cyclic nucleotide-binding domain-containing protein [Roseovarius atlanticus]|uniref:cyclic nucleotide-binding domain-containing protein n=1 Tax=Roseovarius atlanticus TaxID=1641875 RepID=UPI001C986D60|nr:cyclic nucleotide-binding domain-containing protein [Roseovarius atlanticus]MBY5987737.1 cyclic nucleotide-binding domain-containing protein [Roseovarius atlanticus]MBY6123128.1 cyclic nucleotide-binding domain-containing protein [Roseovarius atlanticus]MBY6147624.1 cyclic nucleotide-binding domain-containing protein [Roseovarius atlanticus]